MVQKTSANGRPGRVLFVVTTLTFGGAETQVTRLALELKAQGWAIAIVCLVEPNAHRTHLESQGIAVDSLGMRRGTPDPRALWRFRQLVRNFRPDVVHSHMFHANLLSRLARLVCRFPALICTAHNLRETSERGGPTWHKELLYRATDPLASRTTIICQAAYQRYVRVKAVPASKFQVIPNGVDTAYFAPSAEARKTARAALGVAERFVWLTVGRLVKQKNYPMMFRAFAQLSDREALLLIAGSGPLQGELQTICHDLGIAGRVRFCGTNENILPLFQAADAFVLSSEFEGLSAALIEAAAMSLPAVVTDVGGNGEIVLEGSTGYRVPPNEPARLAEAMERLAMLPAEERWQWSQAARRHCWENFRLETVLRSWTELYHTYSRPASQPAIAARLSAPGQVNA